MLLQHLSLHGKLLMALHTYSTDWEAHPFPYAALGLFARQVFDDNAVTLPVQLKSIMETATCNWGLHHTIFLLRLHWFFPHVNDITIACPAASECAIVVLVELASLLNASC